MFTCAYARFYMHVHEHAAEHMCLLRCKNCSFLSLHAYERACERACFFQSSKRNATKLRMTGQNRPSPARDKTSLASEIKKSETGHFLLAVKYKPLLR